MFESLEGSQNLLETMVLSLHFQVMAKLHCLLDCSVHLLLKLFDHLLGYGHLHVHVFERVVRVDV